MLRLIFVDLLLFVAVVVGVAYAVCHHFSVPVSRTQFYQGAAIVAGVRTLSLALTIAGNAWARWQRK